MRSSDWSSDVCSSDLQGGGHAGHNGLKDIQSVLGSPDFWRLRIGIGHPRTLGLAQQVADFVLHPPRRDEQGAIDEVIHRCRAVVPAMLDGDFALATRSDEHTSELQSLMRNSYAVCCLNKHNNPH